MTLNTDIYVQGEVDLWEMFKKGNEILGIDPKLNEWVYRTSGEKHNYWGGHEAFANKIGQGWPAIHVVEFKLDGWLKPDPAHDQYCDTELREWMDGDDQYVCKDFNDGDHKPVHFAAIDLDTAYGYHGPNGEGCAVLHAMFIVEMAQWLDAEYSVPIAWSNEFTGEIHEGLNEAALLEFIGGGSEANNWFQNAVKPLIEAEAAQAGGTVQW